MRSRSRVAAIGSLAEQRVNQDREHDDVDEHEFAGLHRHVAEAGLGRDRLRDDQGQPHDSERVADADEDRREGAGQDHALKQCQRRHSVDTSHLDELQVDGADPVQRVDVDREEHSKRNEKELRLLLDAEPKDHQWNEREMRHVADHLKRRVGEALAPDGKAICQPQGEADSAADDEAAERPGEAHLDMREKLTRRREFPGRGNDTDRCRHEPRRDKPGRCCSLPAGHERDRQDPGCQA